MHVSRKYLSFVLAVLAQFTWFYEMGYAADNASNPLAAVNNTDLRFQHFDLGSADKQDYFIDGSYMIRPDLKFKYELHYNSTDVSGSREQDFEKLNAKLIHFPSQRLLNETWGVKTAVGLEWILDFGDPARGIGTGSDQIAPLVGAAFANRSTGTTLLPLVQHFVSYNGPTDVNQTALRLIVLQPFAKQYWAKLDLKVPYDWENSKWPASTELQLGWNVKEGLALYTDLLVGVGTDRSFDKGVGLGVRFNY